MAYLREDLSCDLLQVRKPTSQPTHQQTKQINKLINMQINGLLVQIFKFYCPTNCYQKTKQPTNQPTFILMVCLRKGSVSTSFYYCTSCHLYKNNKKNPPENNSTAILDAT